MVSLDHLVANGDDGVQCQFGLVDGVDDIHDVGLARDLCSRFGIRLPAQHVPPRAADTVAEMPELDGARLDVRGVAKAFGGNHALAGVDLVAEPGRVTALIGPNGSGKTTLLNMICGFYKTDAGSIRLGERELQGRAPYVVARAGVARTFQTPNIPAGITVLEAVTAGRYTAQRASVLAAVLRLPRYRRVRRGDYEEARRMLALVGIEDLEGTEATALPLGQRRLLEVARSLVSRPGVLLLDEVASGLDEDEVERLAEVIRRVRDAGGTVVGYSSSTGLYIHAKAIVADYGLPTAKVELGSVNVSTNSFDNNRELGIILTDTGVESVVENAFDSDYSGGTPA